MLYFNLNFFFFLFWWGRFLLFWSYVYRLRGVQFTSHELDPVKLFKYTILGFICPFSFLFLKLFQSLILFTQVFNLLSVFRLLFVNDNFSLIDRLFLSRTYHRSNSRFRSTFSSNLGLNFLLAINHSYKFLLLVISRIKNKFTLH